MDTKQIISMPFCTLYNKFMKWEHRELPLRELAKVHQRAGDRQWRYPGRTHLTKGKNIYKDHEGMRDKDRFGELLVIPLLPKHKLLRIG